MVNLNSYDIIDCRYKLQGVGSLMRLLVVICFNEIRIVFYRDLMGDIILGMEIEYYRVLKKEDILYINLKVSIFRIFKRCKKYFILMNLVYFYMFIL